MPRPLLALVAGALSLASHIASSLASTADGSHQYDVLVLGGGVAGIIAAEQLAHAGIDNFLLVEARDELGGRMRSYDFDGTTIELGCNWVEGTQTGSFLRR